MLSMMTKINQTNIWKLVRVLTKNTTISSLISSRSYLVLKGFTHGKCRRFLERGKIEREILDFVVEGDTTWTNLESRA